MRHTLPWLAAVATCTFAQVATAEIPEALDRASASFGVFYPTVDARISANGPAVAGNDLSFERDLGIDNTRALTNVRLELLILDSQGFSIGGYQYSKGAGTSIARDFEFGGDAYHASAFVKARLRLQTYNAAWHWWFSPTVEDVVGIGLGAAYYDLKGTIDGGISVNDQSLTAHGEAGASAVAPLLTLGWRHAFSPNWRGYADFSGIRKPSGTLTGHLLNGTLGMEYYLWRNLGFALEYSANNLDLKAEKASWEGRARIHFYGPSAFVRLRW
ncbi:MAG TPA: hypothetical protein VFL07_08750 [Rudaea sp.]|nr:hypothetical protein [Rudaea sp.]HSC12990.1 hypothetical protein [Rhodanobacteraceae bacterium]